MESLHGILLHFCGIRLGKLCRTGLNGASRLIFILIIIEALDRCDLNDRISDSIHNAYGELTTLDILLQNHHVIVGEGFL